MLLEGHRVEPDGQAVRADPERLVARRAQRDYRLREVWGGLPWHQLAITPLVQATVGADEEPFADFGQTLRPARRQQLRTIFLDAPQAGCGGGQQFAGPSSQQPQHVMQMVRV